MTARITLILARGANGVIGNKGGLPWRIPEDMRRFKEVTMGKPVVMGRKTWESFPKRPLPGRTNIVITRNPDFKAEGAQIVTSLDAALKAAGDVPEIMILGGAEIYNMALPRAHRIELTEVDATPEGDTFFPALNCAWVETAREKHVSETGLRFAYVTLDRI